MRVKNRWIPMRVKNHPEPTCHQQSEFLQIWRWRRATSPCQSRYDGDVHKNVSLLQHTTAGTPQSFATTSTLTVPVTFASFEASGSFADRGTDEISAWWKRCRPRPREISIKRSRSVMLPSMFTCYPTI